MNRPRRGFGAPGLVALAAALVLAGVGLRSGTWAVGGSDSSCYALMADAFAHGRLQPTSALVADAPWPNAALTLAPAGFIPSPVRPDAASPVCIPGVSILMAPLVVLGGRDALFLFTPIAAGLLVWLASVLARRLAGGMAGAVAAVLVASSPIVLFQAVQPMNDIATATLWIAALTAATWSSPRRSVVAGLLTGLAVLVRPNLALVAVVVAWQAVFVPRPASARSATASARDFALGALPGGVVLLLLNQWLYGGPFASGYGHATDLFAFAFAGDNMSHYARALIDTQTIFPLLGLVAPFVLVERRPETWGLLCAAAAVLVSYAFYRPYPEWWYLRFLLPAVVLLLALASAVCVRLASRARIGGVVPIATVLLAVFMLRTAGAHDAFELARLEGRFRESARLVNDRLPDRAVIITVWESGSMRFHAGREAVLWDSLDPEWLDRTVAWLTAQGRTPYLLFERREEADFRARFREASPLGALDWPPRFDIDRQVRIFDPADRARFLAGERYPTENARPARGSR